MSDLLTDLDLKTERATEPPKRWRNWWRIIWPRSHPDPHGRAPNVRGAVYPSVRVYPSSDTARTRAAELMDAERARYGFVLDEYLGPLPDGEAP